MTASDGWFVRGNSCRYGLYTTRSSRIFSRMYMTYSRIERESRCRPSDLNRATIHSARRETHTPSAYSMKFAEWQRLCQHPALRGITNTSHRPMSVSQSTPAGAGTRPVDRPDGAAEFDCNFAEDQLSGGVASRIRCQPIVSMYCTGKGDACEGIARSVDLADVHRQNRCIGPDLCALNGVDRHQYPR